MDGKWILQLSRGWKQILMDICGYVNAGGMTFYPRVLVIRSGNIGTTLTDCVFFKLERLSTTNVTAGQHEQVLLSNLQTRHSVSLFFVLACYMTYLTLHVHGIVSDAFV